MTISDVKNLKYTKNEIITLFSDTTSGATAFYIDSKSNEFVGLITTDGGQYKEHCRNKHLEEIISQLLIWLNN